MIAVLVFVFSFFYPPLAMLPTVSIAFYSQPKRHFVLSIIASDILVIR